MKKSDSEGLPVGLGTKFRHIALPNWLFYLFAFGYKLTCLAVGAGIALYLCQNYLHCNTCNPVVTVFLCIVSLSCLVSVGLPVDRLVSKDSVKDISGM